MNLGIETERVEFKESTSELKEGCASIASMLNKHGEGTLYFGVKRNGDVSGQDVAESTLRKVSQAIGNYIEPPVYPTIEKLGDDGKDYIRVTFSGSDRPYQCDGRYRIRRSDEDVIMSAAEVARMVRESYDRAVPWDGRPSGRPVSDVDEGALRRFVEEGNSSGRIEAPYTSAQEVLAGLGLLAEDGTLTNAAAALFCRSRVGVRLKAGVLADHSRVEIIDLRQEDDPVFDLIGRAEFYVLSNIRKRIVIDGSPSRDEVPEIPRAALREAIVNAFCHQDFTDYGTAVQVDVFPDSVEITNPGTFPTGRTPEMYLSGDVVAPMSRNPLIARTLFRSKSIEAFGSGLRRIRDTCAEAGVRFEYEQGHGTTTVRFHRNDPFQDARGEALAHSDSEWGLSLSATRVLNALSSNPALTAAELSEELDLSPRQVQRATKELRDGGVIERVGSDKNGTWKILRHPMS